MIDTPPVTQCILRSLSMAGSMRLFAALSLLVCTLCSRAPQSFAQNPSPSPAGKIGVIRGRVLADDGQPLPAVLIIASAVGGSVFRPSAQMVTADENGNFSLNDLDAGAYKLSVNSAGYVQSSPSRSLSDPSYYRLGDTASITMTKGGIITGKVTNAEGEPAIGISVQAVRIRDLEGQPVAPSEALNRFGVREADDRGIYRIYGLEPGAYLVFAGGRSVIPFASVLYSSAAPTYYPSSTRSTAQEVLVRASEEATGIDIRFRGEAGHVVSGKISGAPFPKGGEPSVAMIALLDHARSSVESTTTTFSQAGDLSFTFSGVPDGDYDLIAMSAQTTNNFSTEPKRVVVKGADVTGIELTPVHYASITGKVILVREEPECEPKIPSSLPEVIILPRRETPSGRKIAPADVLNPRRETVPNSQGDFTIGNLQAATYHIETNLPHPAWYVRSMTLASNSASKQPPRDVASPGISTKLGEEQQGLAITLGTAGAGLRGKVLPAREDGQLPARMRVFLVPAEQDQANAVLRYFEASVSPDGSFSLSNLAPGRYWSLIREVPAGTISAEIERPIAWDTTARAKLRREAEAAKQAVELKPCQQAAGFVLRY